MKYIDAILEKLTPDDVRCLIIAEDELARCTPLERIFPTDQTYKYLKYNDTPRYYNRLLDAWESRYANNRTEGIALLRDYCQSKYHLEVPAPPAKKVSFKLTYSSYTPLMDHTTTRSHLHFIYTLHVRKPKTEGGLLKIYTYIQNTYTSPIYNILYSR